MSRLENPLLKWAVDLLNYAGPDETGVRMVMLDDLMEDVGDRFSLERATEAIAALNADEAISNGEIKGLLNRASGKTWGIEYHRTYRPREFLAELKGALKDYLRRHPELR